MDAKESKKKKTHRIPLRITDTTLRDAHQSLWATRMRIGDIMDIIDVIDSVGYYSLEMWGGATFDVCLRFLRENPWERLRLIKSRASKTPLQMLLRGQNILGYKNYPDDLLDRFVALAIYNGIDIFRIFDALNDTRNLEYAIKAVKKYGGHAQGTICYTISPYHTINNYVKVAKEQVELGIDTLCIKDMAGILSPISAEKLISALIEEVNIPIQLHCHASSGMAYATYVEGVRAGAGAIDCAIAPLAGFSSQPPVETMATIFSETDYAVQLDFDALQVIANHFTKIAPKMKPTHSPVSIIDPDILIHQIPGGMISNLRSQLAQQKSLDKLEEVLAEVPRVRADLGFPPLVTPTSQIVGTQAVLNILSGERYKIVPNEIKNYVRGLYGRPPAKISPEFTKLILGDEKPVTHRPADDLEPLLPKATENLDSSLIEHEEDIISYCLFPEQALEYFKWRNTPPEERPPAPVEIELAENEKSISAVSEKKPEKKPKEHGDESLLSRTDYNGFAEIMDKMAELNITELVIRKGEKALSLRADADTPQKTGKKRASIASQEAAKTSTDISADNDEKTAEAIPESSEERATIVSPLTGKYYSSPSPGKPAYISVGSSVKAGEKVCIVEAMKLINEINAPFACRITEILVKDGENVEKDQPLMAVELL